MIPDWLNESHLSMFPEELRDVANIIGFNNLVKLMIVYRSNTLYFPRLETITKDIRNDKIHKEFDGTNQKKLAKKYALSTRYIYDILAEANRKKEANNS